jgi:hypothetical protein
MVSSAEEHLVDIEGVSGSIPLPSTIFERTMSVSAMFGVLPPLDQFDPNDELSRILSLEFVDEIGEYGVQLTKEFRKWLFDTDISYVCRVTKTREPVITFSEESGVLLYEGKINPLWIELPDKVLTQMSTIRPRGSKPVRNLWPTVDDWVKNQLTEDVQVRTVVTTRGGYFQSAKTFGIFANERDYIVFKLKWL